jgi:hypothetical protein
VRAITPAGAVPSPSRALIHGIKKETAGVRPAVTAEIGATALCRKLRRAPKLW